MTLDPKNFDAFCEEIRREAAKMDKADLRDLYEKVEGHGLKELRGRLDGPGLRLIAKRGMIGCAEFIMLIDAAMMIDGMPDGYITRANNEMRQIMNRALDSVRTYLEEGEYHIRRDAE